MKKDLIRSRMTRVGLLAIALLLLVASVAHAESTGYALHWWTVDGGGGHASSSKYSLNASIGQPDAGRLTSDGYTVLGGFWGGRSQADDPTLNVYLPLTVR